MTRLLEREEELGLVISAADAAARGDGCLVLLGGEAGIGKTSLVRAARDALPAGVAFLPGACEPLSVPVPLQPWWEIVEAAGAGELVGSGGQDPFSLTRTVFAALADRWPVVAVIEDAHWADPLTLDLLRSLARRIERSGIAIIVTYRDDEVDANPPLRLLLGDLASSPIVHRLLLRPLSGGAVGELAAGSGLDRARLLDATGGNPFLVVEAIAAGGRLPASVRDAALARSGRLSAPAREVVDVAAVAGQRVELALMSTLVGDRTAAVEEALARGVLVADGPALGFRHELIRASLEQSISSPRRTELHARVFAALAQRPGGTDAARLAHHAELGGLPAEAARYAAEAAAEAERVGALRETYLQAERALRVGRGLSDADRFELLIQYARAANFANPQLDESAEAAEQAVALADRLADQTKRGRALLVLCSALWSLERVRDARAAADGAIAAFAASEDIASLAWAYAARIRLDATAFDPAGALETAPRALALAQAAAVDEVRVDLAISVGLARGHRGERAALAALEDALAQARAGGFTIRIVRAYVNLVTVAVALRDHNLADAVAAEAAPILEELHTPIPALAIASFRGRSLLDRGRWDEALSALALIDGRLEGEMPVARAFDALIRARRGDTEAGREVERAWSRLRGAVDVESARHGMVRLALVEAAWLRGEHAAARAQLTEASNSPATIRFARSGGELALWGSRLGVRLDVPAGAPAPVALELDGDWRRAIAAWRELDAPYEAALAALPGDDRAAREAMGTLRGLGADGAARAFGRERAARGARPARGPRRSTLAHPAGLTRREQEVLEALATGASNAEIGQSLHLSERTVAHHVSAILSKLGAHNRHLAIDLARSQGLLSRPPT